MDSSGDSTLLEALERSYEELVGSPFPLPSSEPRPAADWVYRAAPFGLLAHDASDDPLFVYANQTAQRLFEYSRDEIVGLPSRLSAAVGQDLAERSRLFDELEHRGFCSHYGGRRVTKSGRHFWIQDATIWNVLTESGDRVAQAAILFQFSTSE